MNKEMVRLQPFDSVRHNSIDIDGSDASESPSPTNAPALDPTATEGPYTCLQNLPNCPHCGEVKL